MIATRSHHRPPFVVVSLFALSLAACGGGGGDGDAAGGMQMPPADVSVATVVARDISRVDEFSGRIASIDSVEIRPRAAGYIAEVHFTDGAEVGKGDLLFTIDDREYRAAADSARAQAASVRTRLEVARTELARTQKLAEARAASAEELEQRSGAMRQAEADLAAAEANARQAALSLEFTRVRSPISGRVGEARVRAGNLVGQGEPVLTTVVSLDPVYVVFEGNERVYLAVTQASRTAKTDPSAARPTVAVGLSTEDGFPHQGELVFVDNALDPASGTIRARARLDNADRLFTPGLFARVRLTGSETTPGLLIHDQAVLTDQDRKYVYVVGKKGEAERRDIVLGPEFDGLRVVSSGLGAGDRVVVNGTRKIFFPGAPLAPREVPMDQPGLVLPPPAAGPDGAPSPASSPAANATEG